MDDEGPPPGDADDVEATAKSGSDATPVTAAETAAETGRRPWVSWLAVAFCIGIWLAIKATGDEGGGAERLSKFGWLPADEIWDGKYWPLFTTAFVHLELWHLAFNAYWVWILGSRMERAIGSLRYLAFFMAAACISSAFELAVSGGTGIGASGVVYAMFGFMWLTRDRYASFHQVLDGRTIQVFVLWLVGCIAATFLDMANIGNAAHVSGLAFGAGVAGVFVLRYKRPAVLAGLIALVAAAVLTMFWCPWRVEWRQYKAYTAHAAGRYDEALRHYGEAIRMDPNDAWGYLGRSGVYEALGDSDRAAADTKKAFELDPSLNTKP